MSSPLVVILPEQLTEEHRQLMVRFARLPRAITRTEWVQALAAFDLLHSGQIRQGRKTRTFQRFYQQAIDTVYATPFLEALLATEDAEVQGLRLVADYWARIVADLTAQGIADDTIEPRIFLAYCLYWWQSFGKGYIREVAVFRDLEQSGILFEAHNLRDPVQRRSAYDLIVLSQRGDIKTSTYFLHNARHFPLRSDFYMVRLFNTESNRWLDIVLLKRAAWRKLNGEPTSCAWDTVAHILPAPAQVEVRGETLVVVMYAEWKARVLSKQSLEEDTNR